MNHNLIKFIFNIKTIMTLLLMLSEYESQFSIFFYFRNLPLYHVRGTNRQYSNILKIYKYTYIFFYNLNTHTLSYKVENYIYNIKMKNKLLI